MGCPELSGRLRMNACLVPRGSIAADIGCDHGYVSIYLAREGICPRVIAMDVNPGPLRIARENVERYGVSRQVECRLSDGMAALAEDEVDTLLMAGMGGLLMCRILCDCPDPAVFKGVRVLILQPQSHFSEVRRTIYRLGFYIDEEAFCVDGGKDYLAIRAFRSEDDKKADYTDSEYAYGRYLPAAGDRGYREYLLREREKIAAICHTLTDKKSENSRKRTEELSHILDWIDDRLNI